MSDRSCQPQDPRRTNGRLSEFTPKTDQNLVKIGQIVTTHGIKGGLKVATFTDFPSRFAKGETVIIKGVPRRILSSSWNGDQVTMTVQGVETMTEAEQLKWSEVFANSARPKSIPQDEFLASDLIGLAVVSEEGVELGKVQGIEHAPAQDLLLVSGRYIPFVKEFVKAIDIENSKLIVRLIPGLLDDEPVREDT